MRGTKIKYGFFVAVLALASALATSCIEPPLYLRDWGERELRLEINVVTDLDIMWQVKWKQEWTAQWDSLKWGEMSYHDPKSVRMHVYTKDVAGQYCNYSVYNFASTSGTFTQLTGCHDMLFHNNDTESIRFSSTDIETPLYATTTVVAKGLRAAQKVMTLKQKDATKAPSTKVGPPMDTVVINEPVAYAPDQLFSVMKQDVVIPSLDQYYKDTTYVLEIKGTMNPISYIYLFQIDLKNNNGLVVGSDGGAAVSGMSAGVCVSDQTSSADSVAVVFDMHKIDTLDCIVGRVMTFGLCGRNPYLHPKQYTGIRNYLVMNVTYRTAEQHNICMDITDEIRKLPLGGVIHIELDVGDFPQPGSGGGFDAVIDGWKTHESTIEIK